MEVIIHDTYDDMSRYSARLIQRQLLKKPNSVLGLATGSTPTGVYRELVRLHREEGLDFSQVTTFNLDEYLGLAPSHPQSYRYFMEQHLLRHVNIPPGNVHVPFGHAYAVEEFCDWYEREIQRCGGIDLQILGMGTDGHIAFNEPGSSLGSRTRLKTLAEETIRDNARFFGSIDEVPRFAITMGVGTILEARRVLLLVNGAHKAEIVARAIEGPITAQVTASALQLHPDVIVSLDAEAASGLARAGYHRWVAAQKTKLPRLSPFDVA